MTKTDEELVAVARKWADWHKAAAEHINSKHPDDGYALLDMSAHEDQERLYRALADRLEARGGVPVAWRWRQLHREIDGPITGWCYGDRKPSFSGNHRWEVEPLYASLSRGEPEGFKLVPVKPTPEMLAAVAPRTEQPSNDDYLLADLAERLLPPVTNRTQARYALAEIARDYHNLLAAAPAPPAPEDKG